MDYLNRHKIISYLLLAFIGMAVYAINFCKSSYQCSLIFISICTAVFIMANIRNNKLPIINVLVILLINLSLLGNISYKIQGQIIDNLIAFSLVSIFFSLVLSHTIASTIKLSNDQTLIFKLLICSVLDSLFMSIFLHQFFDLPHVLSIFMREVLVRGFYVLIMYCGLNMYNAFIYFHNYSK